MNYRRINAIADALGISRDTARLIWDLTEDPAEFYAMASEYAETGVLTLID